MTTLRATISRDGNDLILAIPGPVAEHLDVRETDVLSWDLRKSGEVTICRLPREAEKVSPLSSADASST
jgi:antitoxin component of MazEF toxin-antitoxin module